MVIPTERQGGPESEGGRVGREEGKVFTEPLHHSGDNVSTLRHHLCPFTGQVNENWESSATCAIYPLAPLSAIATTKCEEPTMCQAPYTHGL